MCNCVESRKSCSWELCDFDCGGMFLAVLPPVIRMARSPLSRAVEADLPVLRIGRDLPAVIVGAPPALTIRRLANGLSRLVLRGVENLFAIGTAPFGHTGACRTNRRLPQSGEDLETDVE